MKDIVIIGVPLDLGSDRRGVDMGPSAIRYSGLSEKLKELGHEIRNLNVEVPFAEVARIGQSNAKYLSEVREVCLKLSRIITALIKSGKFPLVLGGDHSIAIGTQAGIFNAKGRESGVIWLDAHGDFNTPKISPSGNIHGMGLAFSAGQGGKWFPRPQWPSRSVDPKRAVIVGARKIDPQERISLKKTGVHVFSMSDIDRVGMESVMDEAIKISSNEGKDWFHVSLDMDVVDPSDAPGVGTPVRGGITYREAHLAMEMLADASTMHSLEVVEVNPILDQHNATAELAVELILSAMGKSIL